MSGKSTYMRQVACIVLLAQVGSFVPAKRAEIGLVDGIFTRVGALDELAQGRSTFMVEMSELSNILHTATEESLVILDEVGRGTATYDGISIAWAATEYLHNEVGAKTLFATHYHELTGLAENLPRVANVHVAADERDGDVTFLRTVRDGPTDRSYGIHVADLAGVPAPSSTALETSWIGCARRKPSRRKAARASPSRRCSTSRAASSAGRRTPTGSPEAGETNESIDPEAKDVLEDLESIDVNETPPVELITKVQKWQRRLEE